MIDSFQDLMQYRAKEMAIQKAHNRLAPKHGDIATDFELYDINGENPVRLSDFRGKKPVALVFGSFT